ncbi:MAG: hypothetical protein FWE05_06115 [Defluviitaleaceae bacterium]|nr:hypothetical protein [Defluviitaleaceae bacterium]
MMNKQTTINSNPPLTQEKAFIHLLGISGDIPTSALPNIMPSAIYARRLIARLVKDRVIKVVYKDGMRSYRLKEKGKKIVTEENSLRFRNYLTDGNEINKPPSDIVRRKRLLSQSEVLTLMYSAGVFIFDDVKPDIFGNVTLPLADESFDLIPSQTNFLSANGNPTIKAQQHTTQPRLTPAPLEEKKFIKSEARLESGYPPSNAPHITHPSFYTSREYKRVNWNELVGKSSKPQVIRGSRSAGMLLTPTQVFAIYNTGEVMKKWGTGVEIKYLTELEHSLCRNLLSAQYSSAKVGGILIGNNLETLEKYLTDKTAYKGAKKFLESIYNPLYYITNDKYGSVQLNLIANAHHHESFQAMLLAKFKPKDRTYPIEHDALTVDGNPILLLSTPNIPRLIKFKKGLGETDRKGVIFCFDFQVEMLGRYLGNMVEIKSLDFEKVKSRFLK